MSNVQDSTVIAPSSTLLIAISNEAVSGASPRVTLPLTNENYASAALAFATSHINQFDTTEGLSIVVSKFEDCGNDEMAGFVTATIKSACESDEDTVINFICLGSPC